MPESPETIYQHRLDAAVRDHAIAQRAWSLTGNIRLVVAIVMAVTAWQYLQHRETSWLLATLTGVLSFLWLAMRQRRIRVLRDATSAMGIVNQRALDRLVLNWDALPPAPAVAVDRTHPYAWDVNVLGHASLVQRIGTPVTHHGWQALYESLLTDRDTRDVVDRQQAILELANAMATRQAVEMVGARKIAGDDSTTDADGVPDPQPLLDWARGDRWLADRKWLALLGVVGPGMVIAALILWAAGIVPGITVLLPMALNAFVFVLAGGPAASRVQGVVPLRDAMLSYHMVIGILRTLNPQSTLLQRLAARMADTDLATLSKSANLILPSGSLLYFPLQFTLMWDINILAALERWQEAHGDRLPDWLDAMGEWESLAALSVLAHDHPTWTMPHVDATADSLEATALAHPLLNQSLAVANDVSIGPAGSFLFVTGSNMSGKSTLLRALGVNAVLAQAGAPVAATELTMPPVLLSSCMRVEDSLAHGVSFFMAELQRLKLVLDRVGAGSDQMSLYLLDEMLQGTNTAERQIASRRVLAQLTRAHAIGAVSSHDLGLIEGSGLEDHATMVHFSEQFDGESMTFDYTLRPGLATSSNALRLMELLGFEMDD